MAEQPTSTITKKYVSATNRSSSQSTKSTLTSSMRKSLRIVRLGHLLAGTLTVCAALLFSSGSKLTQYMENQAQSTFYELRGSIIPPEKIIILAVDEQSISEPAQFYKTDPKKYSYLESLQSFPFKRAAYAKVIDRLMAAGVRHVGMNVVFDTPSSYGKADDRQLQAALKRYGSKVTLAAVYDNNDTNQGSFLHLAQPQPIFRTGSVSIGSTNFPLEADGKVHRLASEFSKSLSQNGTLINNIPSFDEAVLASVRVNYPQLKKDGYSRPVFKENLVKGDRIYYYGSAGTFEQIPFWHVLDPENWNTYLQQGKVFQDKIVLIGATAKLGNVYYPVPVTRSWLSGEQMSGVEIHANAIATLMQGKAIASVIPNPEGQSFFVLILVGGCALIVARNKRGIARFFTCIGFGIAWGGISYILFAYFQLLVPTAVPTTALFAIGLSYLGTEVAREILRKTQLVDVFKKYSSHRMVQEILSQQDDLKDLLDQREIEICGKTLDGRYRIIKVLGSGGFSETYVAEDTRLPNNPLCVVKQLQPPSYKSEQLAVVRRLFKSEAQTLQKLGIHDQIPQLLAYFEEEEEFYLVQEYIVGRALGKELGLGKCISETAVIQILLDLLQTLAFVHQNGVIHRDIKPSNIIRRESDNKLVLIDFGAVKEVTTQLRDTEEQSAFTIGIGTKGYAPSEQCFGRPQYNSDIYAVGAIAIKALTGIAPHELERDIDGELLWLDKANVSPEISQIIRKMVFHDFRHRYNSAAEVIEALEKLVTSKSDSFLPENENTFTLENSDTPTTPWNY